MRPLLRRFLRGGRVRGKGKEQHGQNESERHRNFERRVYLDLLSVRSVMRTDLSFCAPPSSAFRIYIADVCS
jgi:hypothetical protein